MVLLSIHHKINWNECVWNVFMTRLGWLKKNRSKKGNHWPTGTRRDMWEPFGCLALWLEKGPKQRRAVNGMYPGGSARCSLVWLIYWEVFWALLGWSDKSKATKRNEGASLTKQRLRKALYSTHTGFIFSSYVAVHIWRFKRSSKSTLLRTHESFSQ